MEAPLKKSKPTCCFCRTTAVSTVDGTTAPCSELLADSRATGRPLLFKNCMQKWPALSKWSAPDGLDYLASLAPSALVEVESSTTTACFYGDERYVEPSEMKWADFLSILKETQTTVPTASITHSPTPTLSPQETSPASRSSTPSKTNYYLNQCPISSLLQPSTLPQLTPDLCPPSFFPCRLPSGGDWKTADPSGTNVANNEEHSGRPTQLVEVNLWVTQHLSRTNWHYDTWNNLLGLVRGRKEVLLCPPSLGSALNPHPVYAVMPNHCKQTLPPPGGKCSCEPTPFAACAEHLREIPLLRATLEPGDMLFLPEGWWHQVDTVPLPSDSLALTIAINYWWGGNNASSVQDVKRSAALQASQQLYMVREGLSRLIRQEQDSLLQDIEFVVNDHSLQSLSTSLSASQVLQHGLEVGSAFVAPLDPLKTLLSLPPEMLQLVLHRTAGSSPLVLCELLRSCSPACCVALDRAISATEPPIYHLLMAAEPQLHTSVDQQRIALAQLCYSLVLAKYFGAPS